MVSTNLEKGTEHRKKILCTFLQAQNIAFDIVGINIGPYRYEIIFDDKETWSKAKGNDSLIELLKHMPHEWVKESDSKTRSKS